MTTLQRMTEALPVAMKAREAFTVNTLRQMIAAVRSAEKSGPVARDLSEDQVQAVLASEVKKRRESAQIYSGAGANERADNESAEADFIESYLPATLSEDQLRTLVTGAIAETGASTVKQMGAVMKAVNAAAAGQGRVDGKALSALVREALSA